MDHDEEWFLDSDCESDADDAGGAGDAGDANGRAGPRVPARNRRAPERLADEQEQPDEDEEGEDEDNEDELVAYPVSGQREWGVDRYRVRRKRFCYLCDFGGNDVNAELNAQLEYIIKSELAHRTPKALCSIVQEYYARMILPRFVREEDRRNCMWGVRSIYRHIYEHGASQLADVVRRLRQVRAASTVLCDRLIFQADRRRPDVPISSNARLLSSWLAMNKMTDDMWAKVKNTEAEEVRRAEEAVARSAEIGGSEMPGYNSMAAEDKGVKLRRLAKKRKRLRSESRAAAAAGSGASRKKKKYSHLI